MLSPEARPCTPAGRGRLFNGEDMKFRMTTEQRDKILNAMKLRPLLCLSGGLPVGESQQESANRAWRELGAEMGFNDMTVTPSDSGNDLDFNAEPTGSLTVTP